MSYGFWSWAPKKTVVARRADAERMVRDAANRGTKLSPVTLRGRTIAETFWGKAWCDNLERYQDFAHRLDRGRSYVRSGSVVDLQIGAQRVVAKVSGSELYTVEIKIAVLAARAWTALRTDVAGKIGSRVDLLGGRLSEGVMTRLCADRVGMFPPPAEIEFSCSCPDWATMCKHVAATMYGVGARLDHAPELLFTLRGVSLDDLVATAVARATKAPARSARVLAADGLAALFGIDLASAGPATVTEARTTTPRTTRAKAATRAKPVTRAKPEPRTKTATRAKAGSRAKAAPRVKAAPARRAPSR